MINYFVIRKVRGTHSLVEMLKGYMVGERLGTPDVGYYDHGIASIKQTVRIDENGAKFLMCLAIVE